jgi:hypothetical protein
MSVIIEDEDVIWEMSWGQLREDGSRMYPNHPLKETMFEVEKGLAVLLAEEVAFLNTNWWEKTWPEPAQKTFAVCVSCNDIFVWASADAERILYEDVESVYKYYKKDPIWGTAVWCMLKRNMMPQYPVYKDIVAAGIWQLDLMELPPNPYEGERRFSDPNKKA